MKRIFVKSIMTILCITLLYAQVSAQSSNLTEHISSSKIEELKTELDYTKTKKIWSPRTSNREVKEKETESRQASPFVQIFGRLLFYILLLLVIMVVIGIVVFLFSNIRDDRSIDMETSGDTEDEVTDIHEIDLEEMLSNALSNQNYRLAIRAQFLMILKSLSSRNLIDWSIEKTNRDYLREVKGQRFYPNFQYSAALFDRAWYSNGEITQSHYVEAAPLFEDLKSFILNKSGGNEGH